MKEQKAESDRGIRVIRRNQKVNLGKLGNLENLRIALPTFIPNLPTFLKLIKILNKTPSSQHSADFLSEGA
ncbi:MAG: hypothetical protein IJZ50_01825 [Alistipes sp.]|nr:hypothetical protein [Alistipes sp.]